MAEKAKQKTRSITGQTLIAAVCVAFCVGFLSGVTLTIYKSRSLSPPPQTERATKADKAETNKLDEMRISLEAELLKNPDNVATLTQLGNTYFDLNQYQKAINIYEKSLALAPNDPDVLTDMGVMYRRNKQPQKAIEAFDRAMQADPGHEPSRFNKGVVLMHDIQDVVGAVAAWEELVKLNPFATAPNGLAIKDMLAQYQQRSQSDPGAN